MSPFVFDFKVKMALRPYVSTLAVAFLIITGLGVAGILDKFQFLSQHLYYSRWGIAVLMGLTAGILFLVLEYSWITRNGQMLLEMARSEKLFIWTLARMPENWLKIIVFLGLFFASIKLKAAPMTALICALIPLLYVGPHVKRFQDDLGAL